MEWILDPNHQALVGAAAVALSSLLASVLPDGHWAMKLINVVALNVGKAKNDPTQQKK